MIVRNQHSITSYYKNKVIQNLLKQQPIFLLIAKFIVHSGYTTTCKLLSLLIYYSTLPCTLVQHEKTSVLVNQYYNVVVYLCNSYPCSHLSSLSGGFLTLPHSSLSKNYTERFNSFVLRNQNYWHHPQKPVPNTCSGRREKWQLGQQTPSSSALEWLYWHQLHYHIRFPKHAKHMLPHRDHCDVAGLYISLQIDKPHRHETWFKEARESYCTLIGFDI